MSMQKYKLSDRPHSSDVHIQADYIELICLLTLGKVITKAGILKDIQIEIDLDVNIAMDIESDTEGLQSAIVDKASYEVDALFEQFSYRCRVFGDYYPFEISGNGNILKLHKTTEQVTEKQKLYIFLLLASSLSVFDKSTTQTITTAFEAISSKALKNYLPSTAEVKIFGKNGLGLRETDTSQLLNKIRQLAKDIHESPMLNIENEIRPNNTGDGGLDIVAWIPTGDDAPGFIIALGQCACTLKWVEKQHSSSYTSWQTFIRFSVPPHNLIFIPFCFRDAGGVWVRNTDIKFSIVFDRLRIVNFLRSHSGKIDHLPYNIVDEALKINEPLADLI